MDAQVVVADLDVPRSQRLHRRAKVGIAANIEDAPPPPPDGLEDLAATERREVRVSKHVREVNEPDADRGPKACLGPGEVALANEHAREVVASAEVRRVDSSDLLEQRTSLAVLAPLEQRRRAALGFGEVDLLGGLVRPARARKRRDQTCGEHDPDLVHGPIFAGEAGRIRERRPSTTTLPSIRARRATG